MRPLNYLINFQTPYEYGYDVNEYDEYGNPNVHSKHEVRDGKTVKGKIRETHARAFRVTYCSYS